MSLPFFEKLLNKKTRALSRYFYKKVDKRTEAVVGGNHRKSYYKAAALITALGETLESNGKLHGRMVTIEHYKKMHPRKRAFKAEFEQFNEE